MFNQIICYCVAVSRRAALQLPGVAIPRNERMYGFQIRSNVYFIAYLGFLMRAGDRGPAPSMYCWQCTRYPWDSFCQKWNNRYSHESYRFCKMHGKFWVCHHDGGHTTRRLRETASLHLQKSSCDLVQATDEADRRTIVISKQRTESVYYDWCKCAVANCWNSQYVTGERTRSTSSNRQKNRAIAEADTTEAYFRRMCFTHLLITLPAKWSDISQMK